MPRTVYEYERILTPVSDQKTLRAEGYTPFFSSNVSAGQRDGKDLFIRFHNGSVYKYPNKGSQFNDLLLSPSKGKWVWGNLRRPNVAFSKVGSFPLKGDLDLTDEQMETKFLQLDKKILAPKLTAFLSTLLAKDKTSLVSTMLLRDTLFTKGLIVRNIASMIKGY
jgi:hypothetical protein